MVSFIRAILRAVLAFTQKFWKQLGLFTFGNLDSIVGRVLLSLGFSVVSVKGMDIVINELKLRVFNASNSLPSDVYNLFMLAGGGYCLNMLFGAISFRLAYWTATRATRLLGVKG